MNTPVLFSNANCCLPHCSIYILWCFSWTFWVKTLVKTCSHNMILNFPFPFISFLWFFSSRFDSWKSTRIRQIYRNWNWNSNKSNFLFSSCHFREKKREYFIRTFLVWIYIMMLSLNHRVIKINTLLIIMIV